ncbi:ArsR/SmtB family transcription factor [Aegicerativicinus sediminis]|uniref:ArsR/SmtB family transcription factor n=1 Tax=Aegicerativicinus sediminis TaxID=2893202 RepID=UPI001E34CB8B|nr:metalloregulator ArsR/SmtB family transcription factor [Aegicerativicinus sediminis]
MGASKTDLYPKDITELAEIAKILAHPARISILNYISQQKACICNDIAEEIGLAQPTISQHLKVINDAGLLDGTYKGKSVCYCLNPEKMNWFKKTLTEFLEATTQTCC